LFRAPYGALSREQREYLRDRGYTEVRWNIDSHDYLPAMARTMHTRLLEDLVVEGGGVIVLHDTKPWTADALPKVLQTLETENCRRKSTGERMLVPVTLDFFMRDRDGSWRAVPPSAAAAENRYLERLDRVCATD
jgi:peptidoglycan/xylan/chitin deacetylase (PgdA/CDA1 family)